MKFPIRGLIISLRPFSEDGDASPCYSKSTTVSLAIIGNAVLALVVLFLVLHGANTNLAIKLAIVVMAVSTLIAGYEWYCGMRARAVNQLYVTALFVIGLTLIK